MRIETTTKSGKAITVESIEGRKEFAVTSEGLPGGTVECSYTPFGDELQAKIVYRGKIRNLRIQLRKADADRIVEHSVRADFAEEFPVQIAEAKRAGERVFIKVELDDDMNVHRYYATPEGDVVTTLEAAH